MLDCASTRSVTGILFCVAPNVGDGEAGGERVVGFGDVLREAGDPGASADCGNDRGIWTDTRFGDEASSESGTENSFVNEILMERQQAFRVKDGHLCASAGAAGRAIQGASPR